MQHKKTFSLIILTLVMVLGFNVVTNAEELVIQHTSTIPGALDIVDEAVAEFEEDNPGVTVRQEIVGWGEARPQLMNSLAVGQAPDMVMLGGPYAPEFMEMNAYAPVDEYVSADVIDKFVPGAFDAVDDGEHLYGIPWEGATWGFFYRKDLFEEAGLDPNSPPENWEELLRYARKLTTDDRYGLVFPAEGWEPVDYFFPFLWQAGGEPFVQDEEGKWHANFSDDKVMEGIEFYYDLINKHDVVSRDIVSLDWEGAKNAFVNGDAAMMFNGMWAANTIKDGSPELEGKWATAVNPAGPGGEAALGYPNYLHITSQSSKKELAGEFIDLYYGGDYPTYADRYAEVVGSLNWTEDYLEESKIVASELLAPFAEAMYISRMHSKSPEYIGFRDHELSMAIQSLILDEMTPEEFAREMDEAFARF